MSYLHKILSNAGLAGLKVVEGAEAGNLSRVFAEATIERNSTINAALGGGRAIYGGARIDSARFGGATEADKRRELDGYLRALDWARSDARWFRSGARVDGARVDSDVPMASQGLLHIMERVYKFEHSDLPAANGKILPVESRGVDPAAEEIIAYEMDIAANAQAASTYDQTMIPMVQGVRGAVGPRLPVLPLLIGYETNFMDQRRESMTRSNGKPDFDLMNGKIDACRRALQQAANAVWLYGDNATGLPGLHTYNAFATMPAAPGPWTDSNGGALLTGQQYLDELDKIYNFIARRAGGGELGDMRKVVVYLPRNQYNVVRRVPITAAGNKTVWTYFAEANGLTDKNMVMIDAFAADQSQVYAGGPLGLTEDVGYSMVMLGDGFDACFMQPQPIEIPAPEQNTGLGSVVYFHQRISGMWVQDARRIARIPLQ
jgi:hypothetical protein